MSYICPISQKECVKRECPWFISVSNAKTHLEMRDCAINIIARSLHEIKERV